jgi:hypothetical protein
MRLGVGIRQSVWTLQTTSQETAGAANLQTAGRARGCGTANSASETPLAWEKLQKRP